MTRLRTLQSLLTQILNLLTPAASLILTAGFVVARYSGAISFILFCFVVLAACTVVQLVRFFGSLYDILFDQKKLDRQFAMTFIACIAPFLLIPNVKTIDYATTYVLVRVAEPYLLRKAEAASVNQSDANSTFKYFRLHLWGAEWLIHDESDQVSLDYPARNSEWWKVTKESLEGESCMSNGRRLYSHFFIQYFGCP